MRIGEITLIQYFTKISGGFPGLFEQFTHKLYNNKNSSSLVLFQGNDDSLFVGLVKLFGKKSTSDFFVKVISCEIPNEILGIHKNKYDSLKENYLSPIKKNLHSIEIHIEDLSDFLDITDYYNKHNLLYRGQAQSSWAIESSLFRSPSTKNTEAQLYSELSQANYQDFTRSDFIENICNMQHLGIPTRLVDWTENKLHALYFSCVSKENELSDAAVYMVSLEETIILNDNEDNLVESFVEYRFKGRHDLTDNLEDFLFTLSREKKKYKFFKTKYYNDRIRTQKGLFSIYFEVYPDEADALLKSKLKSLLTNFIKSKKITFNPNDFNDFIVNAKVPFTNQYIEKFLEYFKNELSSYNKSLTLDRIDKLTGDLKLALIDLTSIDHYPHKMNEILTYEKHLKIVIPSEKKIYFIQQLEGLGINSSTVYPDIDGMTRYLKEKYG